MNMKTCDVDTRKHLRVVANTILIGIVMMSIGIAIGILILVNHFLGVDVFPFSPVLDPPYFIVIMAVMLALLIVMSISLSKIRGKFCSSIDLPLI